MKYINTYPDENTYNSSSSTLSKPHVGYIIADNEVKYAPYIDYSKEYLTFEALESGTFTLTVPVDVNSSYMTSISYSTDDGVTWNTTTIDNTAQTITTPTIAQGDKVLWKGEGKTLSFWDNNTEVSKFSSTGTFNVSGNIMSLLYGDNFQNQTTLPQYSNNGRHFTQLWKNSKIVSAANLILPATTLSQRCYYSMFSGCTSLTTAPSILPTTTLATTASSCYMYMFQNCTSLTTAPELPATTLAQSCYMYMFQNCTSLTTAPALPATTLAESCYKEMFSGCTSLTTAPALPATTLAKWCYTNMFMGCTGLTTAPELPATTLASSCYYGMFNGCTSLTTAPALPATTLAEWCYRQMFQSCTSLTTAPVLPATTLANNCYSFMFQSCTSLNSIKMLATDISATNCLQNWVNYVAASGTFTKAAEMTTLPSGASGIPENWTVVDA